MKTLTKLAALAILATTLAAGTAPSSAEAGGFHGFRGHHFGGFHVNFGHDDCWRFGRYVCGPGSRY